MSVCVGELVRRASTAATGPCCPGRHLFLPPPACECRCGERVLHAGAASVRGEHMRRRAGAAASGCCMRVRRERGRWVNQAKHEILSGTSRYSFPSMLFSPS